MARPYTGATSTQREWLKLFERTSAHYYRVELRSSKNDFRCLVDAVVVGVPVPGVEVRLP